MCAHDPAHNYTEELKMQYVYFCAKSIDFGILKFNFGKLNFT